jgi:ribosome-binding factor A
VSILGTDNGGSIIDKLEAHRPALQSELSRHIVLKYTPHLIFHLDESIKRGARVLEILDDLGKRDGQEE